MRRRGGGTVVPRQLVLALGVLALIAAGYFLTWQLFYLSLPLEQVSALSGDVEQRDFRYDGVVYFRGYQLEPGDALELTYRPPWIIGHGTPDLELFIERPDFSVEGDVPSVTLVVEGDDLDDISETSLAAERLQRLTVDWRPEGSWGIARLAWQFVRGEADSGHWRAPDGAERTLTLTYAPDVDDAPPINLATNIVSFRLYPHILIALLGAAFFFLLHHHLTRLEALAVGESNAAATFTVVWMAVFILFAYWVHSGAFISNVFFEGGGRLSSHATHVRHVITDGHLRDNYYRSGGFLIVPFFTTLVEGTQATFQNFREFHPTGRYIVFVLTILGIVFSALMIARHVGRPHGVVYSLLAASFFPFMIDLYDPDADAYFIMVFPYVLGTAVPLLVRRERKAWYFAGLALALFVGGSVKVNPVFLALLVPFAMLFAEPITSYLKTGGWMVLRVAILLLVFMAGGWAADTLQHPDRNVGIEGEPFQDHVLWHIIWGSYGHYDDHSAHWFTRSGRLRNERVAERTGLPETTYLRQSKTATEEVYKPDVLEAVRERPGFFYSTALFRLYEDGIRFYRYTVGPTRRLEKWLEDGGQGWAAISGERVREWSAERDAIRYGEAWKISPLIVLAKLTLRDLSFMLDVLLIVLALIGIFATRNRALIVFLLGVALMQFAFAGGVHSMTRYFLFCSYALLVGLSVFGVGFARMVIAGAADALAAPKKRGLS